ncbi:MAG: glycosyltransferase [Lachnospiraceae bacterium]|nr:glycosyltransferase [Lachnospiraceae bacterium]
MDLISVIVPVYNIDKYIRRCVESIVKQTYQNLQIILVDDGSTDQSGKICDELARCDTRIMVIHQKNNGASGARNAGILHAEGRYIGFVDGDDYIEKEMYECLYSAAIAHKADIASCGYYEETGDQIEIMCCSASTIALKKEEAYRALFERKSSIGCSCCNKLFDRTLFEKEIFTVGIQGEDIELLYRILHHIKRVVCVNTVGYHYAHREGSTTTCPFNIRYMDVVNISEKIIQFIRDNYPELLLEAYAYQLPWIIGGIIGINESPERKKYSKEKKYLARIIRKRLKIYFKCRNIYLGSWIMLWGAVLNISLPVQKCLNIGVKVYQNTLKKLIIKKV